MNTGTALTTKTCKEVQVAEANATDHAQAQALAEVERDYPPWHAWEGVIAGLVYARRPQSSPPMVVRSTTPQGLRAEIEDAERERGLR